MSSTHTDVPSIAAAALPTPVPVAEYEACPVSGLMGRIGDKWVLLVIALLAERRHRYNELHRSIEGISQRMLTRTLRALEDDGLIDRVVYPTVPPAVEYGLTPLGETLLVPLSALADWAVDHAVDITAARSDRTGGRMAGTSGKA
ncbi:winged helix-turn-helix transcriptional regulator [Nocardia rhamnosiphila]|uniref:winged helix-turn-helix transcriptional regulator n=1 Tax=Nocardia rhamnosiphila TaxID=426716 RepID=UPI00068FE0B3|nr:helix-turn-helix domain-containing protein [Nocardia rhamnosiphila]